MRIVVVGLGVQGRKRRRFAGVDYVASVDPVGDDADYKSLHDVPIDRYDAVLACIPDEPKLDLVRYCIDNGKHVLVEKPLWTRRDEDISAARARPHARAASLSIPPITIASSRISCACAI